MNLFSKNRIVLVFSALLVIVVGGTFYFTRQSFSKTEDTVSPTPDISYPPSALENVSSQLRAKLLTNISLTVPETDETINLTSEEGQYSEGYVRIGGSVSQLPMGALVTTIAVNAGGNASDVYLAVFEPGENAWMMTDAVPLIDPSNAAVDELYTDMETIYVNYRTYGGDQAQAEAPNTSRSAMYSYLNGNLENLSGDPSPEIGQDLEGTSWIWVRTEMNDDSSVTPQDGAFVMTFNPDGSFSSTSDCNNMTGGYGYNAATKQITFSEIAQTMKFCPDSAEDAYTKDLQEVESVFFEGENMYLQIKMDSGVMTFSKKS